MKFSKNRTTANFWKSCRTMKWMGLIPFFGPVEECKIKCIGKRYYSAILLVPYLLTVAQTVYIVSTQFLIAKKKTPLAMLSLQIQFDTVFMIISMILPICKRNNWKLLIQKLQQLEKKMFIIEKPKRFMYYFCSYGMQFLFIVDAVFGSVTLITANCFEDVFHKSVFDVTQYWKLSLTVFFYHFTEVLSGKYDEIRQILERGYFRGNFSRIKIDFTKGRLSHIEELISDMGEIIRIMNKILSWPIFLIFISAYVAVANYVNDSYHQNALPRILQFFFLVVSLLSFLFIKKIVYVKFYLILELETRQSFSCF